MGRKRKANVLDDDLVLFGGSSAVIRSLPTLKRARKGAVQLATGSKAAIPEKRAARIKTTCPQNIQERVSRVMSQRFFMIEREKNPNELCETFKVLGSTGNVYTVRIDTLPSCDCPDALKGNHCKHILFIFLKVLGVSQASTYYYFQKALLQTELAEIFANAPAAPNSIADSRIISAYEKATGKKVEGAQSQPKGKRSVDGEDCPVCYETMSGRNEEDLSLIVFCETCCNGLHKECFQQWAKRTPVSCVYCRSPWVGAETNLSSADGGSTTREGYLNMSSAAGISGIRDTSSYHYGPTRYKQYRGYGHRSYW